MKHLLYFAVSMTLVGTSASAEEYSGYESIVQELTSSSAKYDVIHDEPDIIRFHAGVGLVTTQLSLDLPKPLPSSKTMEGFEVRLGIDLFSPHWIAEGALRNFNPEPFAGGEIGLKEFDLLLRYRTAIQHPMYFTIGGGMAARYLQFTSGIPGISNTRPSTPASLLTLGIEAYVSKELSAGFHFSGRNSFISDTPDQQAVDGTVRVTGHF